MQALPIYLDKMFNQYVAIILSVTFVLAFGEVNFIRKSSSAILLDIYIYIIYNSVILAVSF